MSLVGSLEDLGLTDILQIVSLARKSGRLLLRSGNDAGRIVLREGLVRAATVKGEGEDLRSLLVGGGFVTTADFERASERTDREGMALAEATAEESGLSMDRLESLRRERVEHAIMRMFMWRSGEFSFEVREDVDPEDVDLLLPIGINTPYLAMEAARMRDEGIDHDPAPDASLDADDTPVFSGEFEADDESGPEIPEAPVSAADTIAMAALRDLDGVEEGGGAWIEAEAEAPTEDASSGQIRIDEGPAEAPVEVAVTVTQPTPSRPVVAMDADLTALEWFKATVGALAPRVHIFQRVDLAVDRIRQYLARGVVPLVVASPRLLDGSGDPARLSRLRSLAPSIRVLALVEPGETGGAGEGFDGVLERPAVLSPEPERWGEHEALSRSLRSALEELAGAAIRPPPASDPTFRASLDRLRDVSDRMRDPSRKYDVLSLVLGFAADQFSRVGVLMIRGDLALGIAHRGFDPQGPEGGVPEALQIRTCDLPELFVAALEGRRGVCGGLGERRESLAPWLGAAEPVEAYVGPIESGGCVAALLYADQLPEVKRIGDTAALEIVLHEAGLALDRAVLERALAESEAPA